MSRKGKKSLISQVNTAYNHMLAIGTPSHGLKRDERNQIINGWTTYRTYVQWGCSFVKWAKSQYRVKTLEDCKPYVDEYLQSLSDKSPSTQHTVVCALRKLYQSYGDKDFITYKAPQRHRRDIMRSRGMESRSYEGIEAQNKDAVNILKGIGVRRCETAYLTDKNLIQKDGEWLIRIDTNTKGGRPRESLIVGDVDTIIKAFKDSPDTPILKGLNSKLDIHSYRADYCTSVYQKYARKTDDIPLSERYKCRGDKSGLILDKKAMQIASKCLGHNRISVIAQSYLRI